MAVAVSQCARARVGKQISRMRSRGRAPAESPENPDPGISVTVNMHALRARVHVAYAYIIYPLGIRNWARTHARAHTINE